MSPRVVAAVAAATERVWATSEFQSGEGVLSVLTIQLFNAQQSCNVKIRPQVSRLEKLIG
jgi:hypothetical protein